MRSPEIDAARSEPSDVLARAAFLSRWMGHLAAASGLHSAPAIEGWVRKRFDPLGVCVEFEDGSVVAFRWAFSLKDPEDPRRFAVFTEHCGHHEVHLGPEDHLSRMQTLRCRT